jgi:hypothetical protein
VNEPTFRRTDGPEVNRANEYKQITIGIGRQTHGKKAKKQKREADRPVHERMVNKSHSSWRSKRSDDSSHNSNDCLVIDGSEIERARSALLLEAGPEVAVNKRQAKRSKLSVPFGMHLRLTNKKVAECLVRLKVEQKTNRTFTHTRGAEALPRPAPPKGVVEPTVASQLTIQPLLKKNAVGSGNAGLSGPDQPLLFCRSNRPTVNMKR